MKRFLRTLVPAFLLSVGAVAATTAEARQLKFCNQSTEVLSVAYQHAWMGAPDPTFGSQSAYAQSWGWLHIAKGGCAAVDIVPRGYQGSDSVNLYAVGDRGSIWQNAQQGPVMCVTGNDTNFRFLGSENGAGNEAVCNQSGGRHVRGFRPGNGLVDYNFTGGSQESMLRICNGRTDGLSFSVATARFMQNKWVSHGWWTFAPGTCNNIQLGAFSGELYFNAFFANGNSYNVSGGSYFCVVAGSGFALDFAESMPCNGPNQRKVLLGKRFFAVGEAITQNYVGP